MKIEWKSCFRIGLTALVVCLIVLNLNSVVLVLSAAMPLVIGGIIAFVINILMSFYERHYFPSSQKRIVTKTRRPVCMVLATLSLSGILVLVTSLVVPQLVDCIKIIADELPDAWEMLVEKISKTGFLSEETIKDLSAVDWQQKFSAVFETVSSYFGNIMSVLYDVVTAVFSVTVGVILSLIFAFYLLFAKDKLKRQINSVIDCYLKPKANKKVRYIGRVINESFHNYIVGQSIEAVILGVLCMLGMSILGLPYGPMVGALIAFMALIPIAGAYIGAAIGTFMIAMVNPMDALIFLIFIICLQLFEGNVIYPRVVGSSLGLPAIWVLAAVTVGGGMFGIPGMVIGVPFTAAIYRIIRHDVRKKIKASKCLCAEQIEIEQEDTSSDAN